MLGGLGADWGDPVCITCTLLPATPCPPLLLQHWAGSQETWAPFLALPLTS